MFSLFNRFKSTRWDPLSRSHKRLLVLSTLLSFGTLGVAEWYLWFYGSTPDFLQFETAPGEFLNYSTRVVVFTLRILLLLPWGWYVFYQLQVKPVWSTAVGEYKELRKTLSPFLAGLRAIQVSSYFSQLFRAVFTVALVTLILRVGFIAAVEFSAFLVGLSTAICFLEFKAGYYPGSEQEFYKEVVQVVVSLAKKNVPYIIVAGATYGVIWGLNEGYSTWSKKQVELAKTASAERIEQIKSAERIEQLKSAERIEQLKVASAERIEQLKLEQKKLDQSSPPKKGGWFS